MQQARVCAAQRSNESPSGAFKRPNGLALARWRGLAPTSATPTRLLRKCRRIEEVKSRMDRKFSRIENLWPRDGSCPLLLRSKRISNKCFRIVKAQKISRDCAAHVMGSPFAPNEVPAPVLQRRWLKSRYHVRTAYEIFKVQLPEKEKYRPRSAAMDFVGVKRRQNESGVLRGGTFFLLPL